MIAFNKCKALLELETNVTFDCTKDSIYYLLASNNRIISYCEEHENVYKVIKMSLNYKSISKEQAEKYQVMV